MVLQHLPPELVREGPRLPLEPEDVRLELRPALRREPLLDLPPLTNRVADGPESMAVLILGQVARPFLEPGPAVGVIGQNRCWVEIVVAKLIEVLGVDVVVDQVVGIDLFDPDPGTPAAVVDGSQQGEDQQGDIGRLLRQEAPHKGQDDGQAQDWNLENLRDGPTCVVQVARVAEDPSDPGQHFGESIHDGVLLPARDVGQPDRVCCLGGDGR